MRQNPVRSAAALLLALAAVTAAGAEARLRVVTSTQDLAALTAAVGGDRVEVFALAKGYQDPHFVDAKPSFVLQLSRADLLVSAGLELEIGYLPPLVDQSRNARLQPGGSGHLDASVGCEILGRPAGAVSRAMGDVHPFGNPHYWTDPENGRVDRPRDRRPARRSSTRRAPQTTGGTSRRSRRGSPRRRRSGRRGSPPSPAPRWSPSTTPGRTSRGASV